MSAIKELSSEKCGLLHNQLESLPLVKFPFDVKSLLNRQEKR